ncbi:MAG: glycoside hydrolase family 125 protein, partial [Anaerolineae bacterium]|nr:glycoside hydrolase family 125 protein [Anaerolineae bacterium]
GNVWLQRCAYSQLTEGGPVTMPPVTTRIVDTGYTEYIGLENRVLGSAVYLTAQAGIKRDDGGVDLGGSYNGSSLVLVFACGDNAAEAAHHLDQLKRAAPDQLARDAVHVWPARWQNVPADPILRRGLAYGLNCCVPLEDDTTCIITDHMLLPLAWNRDAYYVARGLLNWGIPESVEHVRRHILWMFERADRLKSGLWARSYLVNGRIKDTGYQLDQQLFPLLELVEYAAATGDLATFDRVKHHIQPVIEALLAQKAAFTWLLPTEETPGDDPIPYPYPISSHILLWHVLNELHALLPEHGYAQMARNVKEAINTHLITEHNGRRIYAYAGDGHGHHYLYHDANDIPLVMAPRWGFAETGDPVWRASMEFAFSEANPGATPGRRLGSVHSPGPWPLGEAQEIIAARAMGDKQREERISQRLARAAQWDGALSESYDETTFEVYSRHWFAWPNAMLACIDLDSG